MVGVKISYAFFTPRLKLDMIFLQGSKKNMRVKISYYTGARIFNALGKTY